MHRGHNRAPFNSFVCVKVCVCMLVRQNRGGWLSKKVKGGCCFPSVWYYQRAMPCIPQVNPRQQMLDDIMLRLSFVQTAATSPVSQELTQSINKTQTKRLMRKADMTKKIKNSRRNLRWMGWMKPLKRNKKRDCPLILVKIWYVVFPTGKE